MEKRTVRLVADPYPPYQYEENGRVRGVDHDIIVEAFSASGVEARTTLLPWDECMNCIEEGRADGVYQIVKAPGRERFLLFSDLLRTAKAVFYGWRPRIGDDEKMTARFSIDGPVRGFCDGLKLGALCGYSYHPVVDALKPPEKKEVSGPEALLEGLRNEEFDVALMDQGVAQHFLHELRIEDIVRVGTLAITRELYVAFRKSERTLGNLFNSGLDHIKKTDAYVAVFFRYGVTP